MFPLAKTTFADGACYYGKDDTKCTYAMCSDSTAIAKGNKNCQDFAKSDTTTTTPKYT